MGNLLSEKCGNKLAHAAFLTKSEHAIQAIIYVKILPTCTRRKRNGKVLNRRPQRATGCDGAMQQMQHLATALFQSVASHKSCGRNWLRVFSRLRPRARRPKVLQSAANCCIAPSGA